jgi:predicted ATPase
MGKTAILDATCIAAQRVGRLVLRARGSDLESDFAFGIARQLLERWCTDTSSDERAALFSGSAGAATALVMPRDSGRKEEDTSFALVHGLYWLVVNLATRRPILLAVDDAHWGDDASLRWLAYLAARLDGIEASLVVSLRPHEPRSQGRPLQAVRAAASATVRPDLLSEQAVTAIARKMLGIAVEGDVCASIHRATGGNPFYVLELVRGLKRADHPMGERVIEDAVSRGDLDGVALQLGARLRNLSPHALRLAQAIAILGDGCELRHAAAISQTQIADAVSLATELIRLDVLGEDRPPRFIHPIVQYAVLQTLSSAEHNAAHRAAAGVLYAERLAPGRIAAHVKRLRAVGDPWAVERLCEGARAALENGAPGHRG